MVREDRKEGDKDMRLKAIRKQGGDKDVEILKERDSGTEKRIVRGFIVHHHGGGKIKTQEK